MVDWFISFTRSFGVHTDIPLSHFGFKYLSAPPKEQVGFFENDLEAGVSGEEGEVYLGAGFVESVLNEIGSEKVNIYIAGLGSPIRMEPAIDDPKETYIVAPRTSLAAHTVQAEKGEIAAQ